jgi:hypothetical protein
MATFLFVTASVAIIVGLVGLAAGSLPRTMEHPQVPRISTVSRRPTAD